MFFLELMQMSITPKPIISDFRSTKLLKSDPRKTRIIFEKQYLLEMQHLKSQKNQRRVLGNPWDPSYQILKVLNLGSISFQKHYMEILDFQLN